ncbi:DUF4864 domain-containing protein [Acuticoccus sp.]|uniref:DUF4864 domain-containing protein n=1 Tax=Acuticoccus sp. TaxID=1904378 RepID=UPI003B525B3D
MKTVSFILAAVLGLATVGPAAADPAEVRKTILAQMEALRDGDAAEAYSYAAPAIQRLFPTPQRFMTMVRRGYAPVAEARSPVFLRHSATEEASFAQEVMFSDADGRSWMALYTLAQQPDGSWRITGCYLKKSTGRDA